MDNFCKSELGFTVNAIKHNTRLDLRQLSEERVFQWQENDILQPDRAIIAKCGASEIEISVLFGATVDTKQAPSKDGTQLFVINEKPIEIKFIGSSALNSAQSINFINKSLASSIFKDLETQLKQYCLTALIEVIVINNDGNIFDLFFKALNILFSNINIPNVHDLSNDILISLLLPVSRSISLIDDKMVVDPNLLEEEAAKGIVRAFYKGDECIGVFSEGCIKYNELSRIVNELGI